MGSHCQSSIFQQGEPLLLEAAVHGPTHRPLRIYVDRCVAAVDSDPFSKPGYEIISEYGLVVQCVSKHYRQMFLAVLFWLTVLCTHVVGAWWIACCRTHRLSFTAGQSKIFSGSVCRDSTFPKIRENRWLFFCYKVNKASVLGLLPHSFKMIS